MPSNLGSTTDFEKITNMCHCTTNVGVLQAQISHFLQKLIAEIKVQWGFCENQGTSEKLD